MASPIAQQVSMARVAAKTAAIPRITLPDGSNALFIQGEWPAWRLIARPVRPPRNLLIGPHVTARKVQRRARMRILALAAAVTRFSREARSGTRSRARAPREPPVTCVKAPDPAIAAAQPRVEPSLPTLASISTPPCPSLGAMKVSPRSLPVSLILADWAPSLTVRTPPPLKTPTVACADSPVPAITPVDEMTATENFDANRYPDEYVPGIIFALISLAPLPTEPAPCGRHPRRASIRQRGNRPLLQGARSRPGFCSARQNRRTRAIAP